MEIKSVNNMTVQELKDEHNQRMKAIRQHHAIERDKHQRTPAERKQLLELMKTLYRL